MHANPAIPTSLLYGFLLVLARISGVFIFLPLPGLQAGPSAAKITLATVLTLGMYSRWPVLDRVPGSILQVAGWMLAETAIGLATGLAVAFLIEAVTFAAQAISTQAGFAYASTIDPSTEADSGILLVVAQLFAGMLFFALGLDREVLRLFALSMDKVPPGVYPLAKGSMPPLIRLGASLFAVGVRLALPVVALLVMVDVALALMGRLNQQLHLLSLAFPAKMLVALLVLSWIAVLFPRVLCEFSAQAWAAARQMLAI